MNPFRDRLGRFASAAVAVMSRGGLPVKRRGHKRGRKKFKRPTFLYPYRRRRVSQSRKWLYTSPSARTAVRIGRILFRRRKESSMFENLRFKHPGHSNQQAHAGGRRQAARASGGKKPRVMGRWERRGAKIRGGIKVIKRAAGKLRRTKPYPKGRKLTRKDLKRAWGKVTRKKEYGAALFVFKEAETDDLRWVLLSSNGFRDRDGEIVSTKSLERDVAQWELEGSPTQPLRWWHMSLDETHEKGLELGHVDFRMVANHTLIESGKFVSSAIGSAVKEAADKLAGSIGFRYPSSEPDIDKTFHTIRSFERSLLPKEAASNALTHLSVL